VNLGLMYANGQGVRQDYTQAVQWCRRAAEQGHAGAQFNLGVMYAEGRGVRQDLALAQEWFGKACQNGDQDGCDIYQRLKAGY
ncbi:tetratricopeptide repeat protein, partial [Neisseria flavescens]